ncbi:MAG: hypothetical protein ACFB6R_06225 [Alphaproteobacteria bacterium]
MSVRDKGRGACVVTAFLFTLGLSHGLSHSLSLNAFGPTPALAQSPADLFQKAFGAKAKPKAQTFQAPVKFLIYELGLADVTVEGGGGPVMIDKADLRAALEQVLLETALGAFDALEDQDGKVSPQEIAATTIAVRYDPATLSLDLDVPWELLRVLDISLAPDRLEPPDPLSPAPVSAIVNTRGVFDAAWDSAQERQDPVAFSAAMDAALNVAGTVFEAEADYASAAQDRFRLLRMRIFRDAVLRRRRFAFGDVDVPVTGLQGAPRIVGLSASRNFDLQPERPFQPRGSQLITLERDTVIDVLAGGRVIETFALSPGRYRLTDLPLSVGGNAFDIRLTDDLNRVETIGLSLFFDPALLGAGEKDFGYAIGFESRADGAYQSVDRERWVVSGFHREGLTDALTLGASLQAARRRLNIGGEIGVAGPFGNLSMLGDWSGVGPMDGVSGAVQWEVPGIGLFARAIDLDLGLTAGYTSRRYAAFDADPDPQPDNDAMVDAGVRLAAAIGTTWALSVSGQAGLQRTGARESALSASLRNTFAGGINVDFLANLDTRAGRSEALFALGLSFTLGRSHAGDVSASWPEATYRASWSRRPSRPVRDWTAGLTYQYNNDLQSTDATLRYVDQRGEADLRLTGSRLSPGDGETGGRQSGRVTGGAAASLVYADGTVGLGRPVANSFALVRRHPALSGTDVFVNPAEDAYLARSDGLGALVVPGLSDHVLQQIRLEAPDLAVGQDLGDDRPFLRPRARSGLLVQAGTTASVVLMAQLVDATGAPHALKAGSLIRTDGSQPVEARSFFTNREGRLAMDGLSPGAYRITLVVPGRPEAVLTIGAEEAGLVRAGTIEVAP